jgi:hypothetical protein
MTAGIPGNGLSASAGFPDGKMTLHTNVIVPIIKGAIKPLMMPVNTPRNSRVR